MSQEHVIRLSGKQFAELQSHLYPGDGLEAVCLALCGRRAGEHRHCLSVCKLVHIPYGECERLRDKLTWRTRLLEQVLEEAERHDLAVVKFHSHPSGYSEFSGYDDASDAELFSACASWTGSELPHGSVVMLPCGRMFGRVSTQSGAFEPVDQISVAGDAIRYYFARSGSVPDFADRHAQVFGEGTTGILSQLHATAIGCSGTGSPTIEQLYRLGVKKVVSVDPQSVEVPNLNRMLNATRADAEGQVPKVEVMNRAIRDSGLGTECVAIAEDLVTPEVIRAVAESDVIFGCVDSVFARHVLNKLASTYNIPYFDVGVRLVADGKCGIEHVTGAVHYLQPDGSSLLSRGVYTMAAVQAEALRWSDPAEYQQRLSDGYITGAAESRPAVIPVNLVVSGLGVFEFLCRLHDVRGDDSKLFAAQRVSLIEWFNVNSEDGERCPVVTRNAGRGDTTPLLDMPELSETAEVVAWRECANG